MVRPLVPNDFRNDAALADIWQEHHRYLLDVAYRMLGSVSEAEDVVQDAFVRMLRVDLGKIEDVRGWLVVTVTRLCLDELRSARARRNVYVGPWLPEPVINPPSQDADPGDRVTIDDSVRMAMLLVLERLSPAERAAFVLHDVFQFSFDEVASILERTPAACRQLASRARRHVREETSPARFQVDPTELSRVAGRFIEAATKGDLNALMDVLDANVVGHTDSGGVVPAARREIAGRQEVAQLLLHFIKTFGIRLVPTPVNGEPGILAYQGTQLRSVISLDIRDGKIHQIHGMANPYKLAYAASLLDAPTAIPRDRPRDRASRQTRG